MYLNHWRYAINTFKMAKKVLKMWCEFLSIDTLKNLIIILQKYLNSREK